MRVVAQQLQLTSRRLDLRAQVLGDLSSQVLRASRAPLFEAPFGDRSREFMGVQARRLEDLAARQQAVGHQLRKLSGSLRPVPLPPSTVVAPQALVVAEVDWPAALHEVQATVITCPTPEGLGWDKLPPFRDPIEIIPLLMARSAHVAATTTDRRGFKGPLRRPPGGRVWRFDVPAILHMAARFRQIADAVESAGHASRNELADSHPAVPARLRRSTQGVGLVTARVCSDVARRLRNHATGLERRMHDPQLLGVGPSYGVGSFFVPPPELKTLEVELDIDTAWLDEVSQLHTLMEELLRGLPLSYGSAAEEVITAVGGAGSSPAPRPPSSLPPIRFVPPDDLPDPTRLVVDPVTGVTMTASEYFARYGNPFATGLPAPLVPVAGAVDGANSVTSVGVDAAQPSSPTDSTGTSSGRDDGAGDPQPSVRDEDPALGADDHERTTSSETGTSTPAGTAEPVGGSAGGSEGGSSGGSAGGYSGGGSSGGWVDVPGSSATSPDESSPVATDLGATTLLGTTTPVPPEGDPDAKVAVERGGVRITGEGAGVLAGVVAVGAGGGLLVTRRAAARKVTSWVGYKAKAALTKGSATATGVGS